MLTAVPRYRADIDGLRALAVLAVLAFHAFPSQVGGGYVGVDIFFVISGFLISSIILEKLATNTFTFADFYIRRVKRILPALLVVVLAVSGFGYGVLVQDEYVMLGKHIASAAAFLSNITLYLESGYFDLEAETKPLLHFWSLATEEQFYILWPVALVLFANRRWKLPYLICGVGVASFLANIALVVRDPSAAFYLPVSRFWELMAGGGLAHLAITRPSVMSSPHANVRSNSGLAALAGSIVLFDGRLAYPGFWALLPVAGTVLVMTSPAAWLNRNVLAWKPVVWIGLISYPLYLWHWPLLSYAHILQGRTPLYGVRLAMIACTFLLAWLTYLIVERPIRHGNMRHKEHLLVAGLAFVGLFGLTVYTHPDALNRDAVAPTLVNGGDIGHEEFFNYLQTHFFPCQPEALRQGAAEWHGIKPCFQTKEGNPTIAIVGDSHAEHLLIGFGDANPTENAVYYVRGNLLPSVGNPKFSAIFQYIIGEPAVTDVVLAFWWRTDAPLMTEQQLLETVQSLQAAGKRVHLVKDGPRFSFDPHRCKYSGSAFREANRCSEDAGAALYNENYYSNMFDIVARRTAARVIEVKLLFCNGQTCSMAIDGKLLFRDRHHLNINGSRHLAANLAIGKK